MVSALKIQHIVNYKHDTALLIKQQHADLNFFLSESLQVSPTDNIKFQKQTISIFRMQ